MGAPGAARWLAGLATVVTAAARAYNYTDPGRCGAGGRWGEALEEKLWFCKTTKTGGSSIR